jgi:hypothetical protein
VPDQFDEERLMPLEETTLRNVVRLRLLIAVLMLE